jgi:hypothetical protein
VNLSGWLTFDLTVERYTGASATGPAFADATTERALIDASSKLVRDAGGSEVVSSSRAFIDGDVVDVPPGSRVTMPVEYGGRSTTVIATSRHDSGGVSPIDPYLELALQ